MSEGVKTILYPARDIAKSKALFSAVAGTPHTDTPYYVGFNINGQEIGLVSEQMDKSLTGPVPYFHVADIEKSRAALIAAGATPVKEISNVGGTRRVASVKDADGNMIGLLQD